MNFFPEINNAADFIGGLFIGGLLGFFLRWTIEDWRKSRKLKREIEAREASESPFWTVVDYVQASRARDGRILVSFIEQKSKYCFGVANLVLTQEQLDSISAFSSKEKDIDEKADH